MVMPALFRPPPITIKAEVGKVTLPNGVVVTKDKYGRPLTYPLAEAVRQAQYFAGAPQTIGVGPGMHHTMHVGGVGSNATHAYDGFWLGGETVQDVTLTSLDSSNPAQVALSASGDVTQAHGGGIDGFTLYDIQVRNQRTQKFGFLLYLGSTHGLVRLYKVDFGSLDPTAWNNLGVMSHFRGHGWCQLDARDVQCAKAQEHFLYVDATQGDSCVINAVCNEATGRNPFQFCERMDSGGYGGRGTYFGITRPSIGGLWLKKIRTWSSQAGGGGGADITIAGHSGGPVTIEDVESRGDNGTILVYSDSGKGLAKNSHGYTTGPTYIRGVRSDSMPDGDDMIALGGAESVDVYMELDASGAPRSIFDTNRTGIHVDSPYTGSIKNGPLRLHAVGRASTYAGWRTTRKVAKAGTLYSAAQIDALNVAAPSTP